MQSDIIEITIAPLDGRSLRSCKRIAAEAFDENPHENQAVQAFSTTNQSGFTARLKGKIVGFVLCSGRNPVKILAFAIEKKQRRNGIGRMLLDRIVRLSRQKVIVTVDDRALDAHLLLRDRGFRAVRIERGTLHDRYVIRIARGSLPSKSFVRTCSSCPIWSSADAIAAFIRSSRSSCDHGGS